MRSGLTISVTFIDARGDLTPRPPLRSGEGENDQFPRLLLSVGPPAMPAMLWRIDVSACMFRIW